MLQTITVAGGKTGKTQPVNGLDELLPLPGKKGKATKSLLPNTGDTVISSFPQMLQEGLLSLTAAAGEPLPVSEIKALPLVAGDKPSVDLTAPSTTTGDGPLPQPVVNKAAAEKEENLVLAEEVAPNLMISLFAAVPSLPGTVPATSEDGVDTLPQSNKPVTETGTLPPYPPPPSLHSSDESGRPSASPRETGEPLPTLQPAWQLETAPKATESVLLDKIVKPIAPGSQILEGPAKLNRVSGKAQEAGFITSPEIEHIRIVDITNQATVPSTAINDRPEKTPVAGKQAAASPREASRGQAIGPAGLQTPSPWLRQPDDGGPTARMMGIAPSLPLAADSITNQAAVLLSTAINAQPEKTPVAGRQAVASSGEASRGPAVSLAGLQTSPPWARPSDDGAPTARMMGIAPSVPLAADGTTNQAAILSTAINAQPEKTPVAGRQAAASPGEASREREATLPINVRESLAKTGLGEFVIPMGDAKKDPFPGDKGKPHLKEPFAVPEIMDLNIKTASPLSKGQDIAVPAGSLLAQVAEQLPQAISKGSGRIKLSLEPDNLGKLDMDLVVRENRVQIVLTAESRTVQQTLQGHVEQLKDALQQQGLEVDGFNVLLQNGRQGQRDTAGGGNPFGSEYNNPAMDKKGAGNDNFLTTATPFVPGQNPKKGAEGINIFI